MEIGQGLYAQDAKISWKDLKFIAEKKNKNEAKLKSQGLSTRSQRWFDLDFDSIEEHFITRNPDYHF